MSSTVDFSDDDDSFELLDEPVETSEPSHGVIDISSDESKHLNSSTEEYTSDDESTIPKVNLRSNKTAAISKLFASSKTKRNDVIKKLFPKGAEVTSDLRNMPSTSTTLHCPQSKTLSDSTLLPKQNVPVYEKMIGGVKIHLPVEPYGSQTALMFKVITAINKGQNCLLESPTGSGKTLALLCGALAWQQQERSRISQLQAQQYFSDFPELSKVEGATEFIVSPENAAPQTPEKIFSKPTYGEKSIYDKPTQNEVPSTSISKRQQPLADMSEESSSNSLVNIHKKRRLYSDDSHENSKTTSPEQVTPEKSTDQRAETPQKVSVPTIYYGARTHKQLQQVIKEFKRTSYCGDAKMSILSSRDYSCIREFDKQTWSTKNDMCRTCIKTYSPKKSEGNQNQQSNCKYYDNRQALNHRTLPPAFDLEDLVNAGEQVDACPYYAARYMAHNAQIVFCPYNYLIEPSIRKNMQIDLTDNIVIIDEAHNIEDICRDAASLTLTRDHIQAAIKELEIVIEYRYTDQEVVAYVDYLLKALKNWDYWFSNQTALVNNAPVNNKEAVYTWQVDHFAQTLNNHNIGQKQYSDFRHNANMFCQRLREDPRTLLGVSQATGALVENIDTVLGYLFRSSGNFLDDFSPALIKTITGSSESLPDSRGWRKSQYNQWVEKESLSLKFVCLNPAVVFEGLRSARCILLASGTLTPMTSLHSELGTEFPLKVSPNHVIPPDRVWIGTLSTCPDGQRLECTRNGLRAASAAPALGQCVRAVCRVTPHGVLCFLPSYHLMNTLVASWRETGLWKELNDIKHVFMESRNVRDHNDIMEDYYKYACSEKGALLFAVYRGKVSEGMDFKDHQARAVITIGIPYPNLVDMAVKEKMKYNDKYSKARKLLSSSEWLRVQAYRALNQAVGRCVRHRNDWGAVLLVDARFAQNYYLEHLSKWVRHFLGDNHHTFDSLLNSDNSLETFMKSMTIRENEDDTI